MFYHFYLSLSKVSLRSPVEGEGEGELATVRTKSSALAGDTYNSLFIALFIRREHGNIVSPCCPLDSLPEPRQMEMDRGTIEGRSDRAKCE